MDKGGGKRREDACGDTGSAFRLFYRVSIQCSALIKKRAGRGAPEPDSWNSCSGKRRRAARSHPPPPPPLSVSSRVIVSASRFPGVYCELSLKSALLSILEDTIPCYRVTCKEFLKIAMTFRLLFGYLEILNLMSCT